MTLLTKPIRRELPHTYDRRNWIVELHPWGISFRAKRTRRDFPITWDSIWNRAMQIAAEHARQERRQRRAAKP